MFNLILFGPPGSGKGTQSKFIAEKYDLAHISTGEIFRHEIRNNSTLGRRVKSIIENGELVPDELLSDILRSALHNAENANGFLFDGFPRTTPQAEFLDLLLPETGGAVSLALALEVDEEEIVKRLLKRAQEEGRKDDTEEVIRNRMRVYHIQTYPLIAYYQQQDKLITLHGVGSVEEIFAAICEVIDKARN